MAVPNHGFITPRSERRPLRTQLPPTPRSMSPSAEPLRLSRPSSVYDDIGEAGAMEVDEKHTSPVQREGKCSGSTAQPSKGSSVPSPYGGVPEGGQDAIVRGVRNVKIAP